MSEERKDRLYQFIPDVAGSYKPAKMIIGGRARTFNPDGSVNEGTSVKLNPNAALQYFLPANHPDYEYAVAGMNKKIIRRNRKYGKGNPGSIVEIPLYRKEKQSSEDGNGKKKTVEIEVCNIGNIPEEYAPKTQEQTLRIRIAELEAAVKAGAGSDKLEELKSELAEKESQMAERQEEMKAALQAKDAKVDELLAEIEALKKKNK